FCGFSRDPNLLHDDLIYVGNQFLWLATSKPPIGAVGLGLATYKGRPITARPPARGGRAATRRHGRLRSARRGDRQRPAHKGQPAAIDPQGVAARDQPCRQQGRRRRSQGWLPLDRATVDRKGQLPPMQGQRRRRRIEGEGGLGHIFEKKMVMPLRILEILALSPLYIIP
ncbi:hypothetical protein BHE74_00059488, partial [Ensete ventricosum]